MVFLKDKMQMTVIVKDGGWSRTFLFHFGIKSCDVRASFFYYYKILFIFSS